MHVDVFVMFVTDIGYKEKRANEENAEQGNNSPNQQNGNNERIQNDEREVDNNPERQEAGAQAQDEGKE